MFSLRILCAGFKHWIQWSRNIQGCFWAKSSQLFMAFKKHLFMSKICLKSERSSFSGCYKDLNSSVHFLNLLSTLRSQRDRGMPRLVASLEVTALTQRQTFALAAHWESHINLTCMSLECGRRFKPRDFHWVLSPNEPVTVFTQQCKQTERCKHHLPCSLPFLACFAPHPAGQMLSTDFRFTWLIYNVGSILPSLVKYFI